uniref:Uncharacterized protein n=1 Tax=Noccaea caerulescens TaxID=107243 RepID=A0A1J3H0K2_NOCCA
MCFSSNMDGRTMVEKWRLSTLQELLICIARFLQRKPLKKILIAVYWKHLMRFLRKELPPKDSSSAASEGLT